MKLTPDEARRVEAESIALERTLVERESQRVARLAAERADRRILDDLGPAREHDPDRCPWRSPDGRRCYLDAGHLGVIGTPIEAGRVGAHLVAGIDGYLGVER